ncbi:MAG: hypothetical protein DHS20C13_24690 [Thermodesulfobacteriota bacterium]|nr:MAG: hypothetical protein DHS20C13_24690 [Thermodesulfobacteriota bacterium]
MVKQIKHILALPFEDFFSGLESCLAKLSYSKLLLMILCFVISWWIYVPLHELGHAFGCILGGGSVSELQISPMYGAAFLKTIFPFVTVGSDYAGQLTGFDTKGSDLIYLLTDFFPFLLTIFIGVPLLRSAAGSKPLWAAIKLGLGLPIAFAPFISFSGDYYEMGSIIVSRIANFISSTTQFTIWRSDDVFKLAGDLFFSGSPYGFIDIAGVTVSFILGLVLIYATYMLGVLWSNIILRPKSNLVK